MEREDAFFDGVAHDQPDDVHAARLPDTVRPVGGLIFDGGVPPRVEDDDGVGGREVDPDAAGLQAEEEDAHLGIGIEAVDAFGAVVRGAVEIFEIDPLFVQAVADDGQHGCELAEDQDLVPGVERFLQKFVEEFKFGRGDPRAFAVGKEFRCAADLPHPHDGGEQVDVRDGPVAVFELAELFVLLVRAFFERLVDLSLRRFHVAVKELFLFGRKFEADVRLAAAEHERRDAAHEFAFQLGACGDLRIFLAEGIEGAEEAGMEEVEHAPEVFCGILQRGAGEDDPAGGRDGFAGACVEAERILDVLRLVQDQRRPFDGGDLLDVAAHERVRGNDDFARGCLFPKRTAVRAVHHERAEPRQEAFDLGCPVSDQRGGADDQGGEAFLRGDGEESEDLDGLAEAHFVREDEVASAA